MTTARSNFAKAHPDKHAAGKHGDKSGLEKASQGRPAEAAVCPLCNGTGWRMNSVERRDRKVEEATRCECARRLAGGRLLEAARIPQRYQHCELSNFEHTGLLTGPIGSGKTHIAVGILKELIAQKNTACVFYDYRELLKEIQNSYNASVQTTEIEVLRPVFAAEVLVLDELGAAKPTEWVWDTVSHILNTRYNDQRTTIITTNYQDLPPAGAESDSRATRAVREETLGDRIGERMRSRLHEMCRVVRVEGEDFRMKYRSASLR